MDGEASRILTRATASALLAEDLTRRMPCTHIPKRMTTSQRRKHNRRGSGSLSPRLQLLWAEIQ